MRVILSLIKKYKLLFFLTVLFFMFGFPIILSEGPYGMHIWRQADCVSIADNYFTNELNFWEPEIHNYISDDWTSGKTAGEFPILYYIVAILWDVFGKSEGLFRILVFSLNVIGFYYLFKVLKSIIKIDFWAFCITLCFFSSPILLYYGSSFLTNVPAFSLAIIGWYNFHRFYTQKQVFYLYISLMFFVIAGLLKITAFISGIALFGLFGIELIQKLFKYEPKVFHSIYKCIFPFLLSFIILFSWYKIFIDYYTNIHYGKYTFNDFWPIWEMSSDKVVEAWNFFLEISFFQIMNPLMWVLFIIGLIVSFLGFKKIGIGYSILLLGIFTGTVLYILCWFNSLLDHDYYLINLTILPLFSVLGLILYLKEKKERWMHSKKAKWLVGIITVFSILYGANNLRMRYADKMTYWKGFSHVFNSNKEVGFWKFNARNRKGNAVREIEGYLEEIGVGNSDLVICASDPSFCVELYLINRKGWTNMNINNSAQRIDKFIQKGAKFLIVSNPKDLNKEHLQNYLNEKIGEINGVNIYKL